MSELDFGPRERDFFVYQHMLAAATKSLDAGSNVLNPKVSYGFAQLDQTIRCRDRDIDEKRILLGLFIADIDTMDQLLTPVDDFFEEI
jgi:hypothetical protein